MSNFSPRNLKKAQIIPVKLSPGQARPAVYNPGGRLDTEALGTFYINPSTWSDNKSTKWAQQDVPGLSDPHQQWISGGPRTITFEALITNDRPSGEVKRAPKTSAARNSQGGRSVVNRIGGIAAQIFNIPELSTDEAYQALRGKDTGSKSLDLDITDKLAFYRSLCYPNAVDSSNRVTSTPNPVQLRVGTTFGQRVLGDALFVVNSVNITITKQMADLTPIEARVTFTLTELVGKVLSSDNNILTDF